jgi:hypothetical protein
VSNNRLTFDLTEIRAGLRELARSVSGSGEAGRIVEARGNRAAATIKAGYPSRAGHMRNGVTVEHTRSPVGARSTVRNTDKDAAVFEVGSQARHTKLGANRGTMPANPLFSQTMRRERRGMHEDHKALLERLGLLVTGDAG